MAQFQVCAQCHERIAKHKHCRCGERITTRSAQCRACVVVTQRQRLAEMRARAIEVSRQRTIERRKARFSAPMTKSELWHTAYNTGYQACWQSYQRAIQRGDVVVVRERRERKGYVA